MGIVFFDVGISLDGFMAGENRGPDNPLGDGGLSIHKWMFKQKAFWKRLQKEEGEEDGPDGELIEETFDRVGAYIMGKRMFEEGEANWPEDLFRAPVYVLTHENREPWVQKRNTTFYFTHEKIEDVLKKARADANGKDVRIQGSAHTIQQYLSAELVDEFRIHLAPFFINNGIRLFDNFDADKVKVELKQTLHISPLATHIIYNVIKSKSEIKMTRKEMKKLHFSIEIKAPKKRVWETMLNQDTYRKWTDVFAPGSHYEGSWNKGSKILFLAPNDDGQMEGMVSRIKENKRYEFISIEHLGMIQNGKEDTSSEWAGALENYMFKAKNSNTELTVDVDTEEEYIEMFGDMWPKALQKLKKLAEK